MEERMKLDPDDIVERLAERLKELEAMEATPDTHNEIAAVRLLLSLRGSFRPASAKQYGKARPTLGDFDRAPTNGETHDRARPPTLSCMEASRAHVAVAAS
jgi:hypothetical protein